VAESDCPCTLHVLQSYPCGYSSGQQKSVRGLPVQDLIFVVIQAYLPTGEIFTGIGVLLSVRIFLIPLLRQHYNPLSKATKAISASQNALTNVFERIEIFFRRLETYVQVPPTAGMTQIMVEIMIEVLSILAIVTREVSQGRAGKLIACMNRHCRLIVTQ